MQHINFRQIGTNLLNKSPKIVLLMLVMFGISLHSDTFFGISLAEDPDAAVVVELPSAVLNDHYQVDVALSTDDSLFFTATDRVTGQTVGSVISSVPITSNSRGYGGVTPVMILLDTNQIIGRVAPLANSETPKFINRLQRDGFFDQWVGRHIFDDMTDVDIVSGATMSSRSLLRNVDGALKRVVSTHQTAEAGGFSDYLGSFAVLAVVVASLIFVLFPAQMKRFRLLLLLTSIGVLGIWQGAFVSIELLYQWIINGTSFWDRFGLVAVVVLSIIMPLLLNKAFYCQWVCPFGAAQELAGKLYKGKIAIAPRVITLFHWVRRVALVAIIVILFTNHDFNASDVEPFTIFMIKSASVSVIIIAVSSLVASVFVFKPWCRLLCPTGELLNLLLRTIRYTKKK